MNLVQKAITVAGYYKTSLLRRLNPNYRKSFDYPEESQYWKYLLTHLETCPPELKADFLNRMNPNRPLQEPFTNLIRPLPEPWRILDVGCGPLSTVGLWVENKKIELIGADPLADEYTNSLKEAGIAPNCQLVKTDCLDLVQRFSQGFSITTSNNALDHAPEPLQIIRQMAMVTAPNGYVRLRHVENEGIRERYHGLHQWNFSIKKGVPTLSDGSIVQALPDNLPELELVQATREKLETTYVIFLFRKKDNRSPR